MNQLIKNILFVFAFILSSVAISAENKLGGMVVFPNQDKIFSAVIYLDDKIKIDNIKVNHGYSMDYYRYGLEHSNVLPLLDFKIKQDNNNYNYVYIESSKPVNKNFDLVLRLTTPKKDMLCVYKIENSNKISYFPNELNEKTKQEEVKNNTLKVASNVFDQLNQLVNNNVEQMLVKVDVESKEVKEVAAPILFEANEIANNIQEEVVSNQYFVVKGDNITKIASKFSYMFTEDNLYTIINKIYKSNKNAFIDNDINKIKTGFCLMLPFGNQFNEDIYKIEKEYTEQKNICVVEFNKNKDMLLEQSIDKKDNEIKNNQYSYHVVNGDCLSKIAYNLKANYPNVRWKKIMEVIYQNNKSAFIKGSIDLLKADAILQISEADFI